jgi:cyclophilin family peptidyl-prolyl cis-trans isomerase/HEAT repeat protein
MTDLRRVIRYSTLVLGFAFLAGCEVPEVGTPETPTNRWSDERLWPVLEAQEHRDIDALCTLLKDDALEVREAAALAFASVQDTLGIPCLMGSLSDASSSVRSTAVFALGFVADSLAIERMAELAMNERDSTVQRAYLSASFLAMQRNGMLKDPQAILYYLESSRGHERVRAADALRRLPDSVLVGMEVDYLRLVVEEKELEVKAMLVRGIGTFRSTIARKSILRSMDANMPVPMRINAMRAFASMWRPGEEAPLLAALADGNPVVRRAALEELSSLDGPLDPKLLMNTTVDPEDAMLFVPWYGLLNRLGLRSEHPYKGAIPDARKAPYAYAEWIRVAVNDRTPDERPDLWAMLKADEHAAVRQAAFQALVQEARDLMAGSRFANIEAQYARLGEVVRTAMATGDAGLISAACEVALEEEQLAIRQLVNRTLILRALESLHPIADLEAIRLLAQLEGQYSHGRSSMNWPSIPFNHPINKERLSALKQGQRYRITTAKGIIILTTDVNDCPGSSLAFDSLVTAGYYNGKAFHRMVPNFVVQGGCPRGDGYGGMPWTLRTEIGRKLFTAGSVGLASAGRDTESCQFFITHSAAPHLDGRYTRFGEVVEGIDVVWQLQVGDVMERVERID